MGDHKNKPKCLKKSNILVYQQPTGKRTERSRDDCKRRIQIPICTPEAKNIRVCTGAELRKMCAPKVCPCEPVKKRPFGLLRVLGFGLKSAIAAAMVYITYDMGIWGTTDDTQQFYGNACSIFGHPLPKKNRKWDPPSCEAESDFFTTPEYKPYAYCDEPPVKAEDAYEKMKNFWNRGVTYVFHGMANFPGNIIGKFSSKMPGRSNDEQIEEGENKKCVCYSELSDDEKQKVTNVYK